MYWPTPLCPRMVDLRAEIGVALTSFGGLFMLLGVMLFFDGALLALGNVSNRVYVSAPRTGMFTRSLLVDTLPRRANTHHWSAQNVLLLRAEAEAPRDSMLHRRDSNGVPEVAVHWDDCGDDWVLESLWVRHTYDLLDDKTLRRLDCRDFFPVILTFLRQLPGIGHVLTLPYIRDVSTLSRRCLRSLICVW